MFSGVRGGGGGGGWGEGSEGQYQHSRDMFRLANLIERKWATRRVGKA